MVAKRDGQVNLPERVRLHSRDHAVEGRARRSELRPGDAHDVEGVDIEDVEATTSVHQQLGEALLADNGVDDEQVASWSGNMGWMVPLIKGDWRFQPAKKGGDGRLGGTCLPIAHLVLVFGLDGVGSTKDHDAFLRVEEAIPILARRASFLGCRLFVVSFFQPTGLS